jgi:hypothetical protein
MSMSTDEQQDGKSWWWAVFFVVLLAAFLTWAYYTESGDAECRGVLVPDYGYVEDGRGGYEREYYGERCVADPESGWPYPEGP